MVIRVRSEKNEPLKDLHFWSEALVTQMKAGGYRRIGEGIPFSLQGRRKGFILNGSAFQQPGLCICDMHCSG